MCHLTIMGRPPGLAQTWRSPHGTIDAQKVCYWLSIGNSSDAHYNLGQYMAAEAARIPALRTLQENFIHSKTFETMCFPCALYGKLFEAHRWTLLHAICLYIRQPRTAHCCSNFRDLRPTIPERAGQSLHHENTSLGVLPVRASSSGATQR